MPVQEFLPRLACFPPWIFTTTSLTDQLNGWQYFHCDRVVGASTFALAPLCDLVSWSNSLGDERLNYLVLYRDYFFPQLSHEKRAPGWLGFIGDYTIQLYRDYNQIL